MTDRAVQACKCDLLQTMDAQMWAREFCRFTGFADEEWAHTWFANAIMCGWDHCHWSTPEYKARVAAALNAEASLTEVNPVNFPHAPVCKAFRYPGIGECTCGAPKVNAAVEEASRYVRLPMVDSDSKRVIVNLLAAMKAVIADAEGG